MAGQKESIGVSLEVQGLKPLLQSLNGLGKDVSRQIRAEVKEVAAEEVPRLQAAARASDKLSAAVGVSLRARADRVPKIVGGGAKRLPVSGRPKAGEVFFGAEYGGGKRKTTKQFRPHRGKEGYWLWKQVLADQEQMMARWTETLDKILSELGDT